MITKFKRILRILKNYDLYEERKLLNALNSHVNWILHQEKIEKNKLFENNDLEFYGFSQGGEDGIIALLCRILKLRSGIEFGTEDWKQSNLRLSTKVFKLNVGLIDGSPKNIEKIKTSSDYYFNKITAISSWITAENINSLVSSLMKKMDINELDILSIDIDGNDYYIAEKLLKIHPKVLIIEVNDIYGPDKKMTTPYNPSFYRYKYHYSGSIYGASYSLLCSLLTSNGYKLFAHVSSGNNLIFVRESEWDKVAVYSSENLRKFKYFSYRESSDRNGKKTYLNFNQKKNFLYDVQVIEFK